MLTSIFLIIIGLVLLAWAAERFVTGAVGLAYHFGASPLLIGLTVVALGTSAPEIFVAIDAARQGDPALGIGHAIGSNIANIGLVLGLTALIKPLRVQSQTLRREYPILFLIMILTWVLFQDGNFSQLDGILLLIGLLLLMLWFVWQSYTARKSEPLRKEYAQELKKKISLRTACFWTIVGIILLPLSARLLVIGAVKLATIWGVSDLFIGLTIVAIGTSVPELATSIVGAIKGEHDIAIGNILGSNMFNLLAVLPFVGLIAPGAIEPQLLSRDLPIMFGATLVLFAVAYGFRGPGHVTRLEGALLLICYVSYIGVLYSGAL